MCVTFLFSFACYNYSIAHVCFFMYVSVLAINIFFLFLETTSYCEIIHYINTLFPQSCHFLPRSNVVGWIKYCKHFVIPCIHFYHTVSLFFCIPHCFIVPYFITLYHCFIFNYTVSLFHYLPHCFIVPLFTTLYHYSIFYHTVSLFHFQPHCSIVYHTVSLFHFQPHCIIIPFSKTLFHFSIVYHTAQYCVWLEPNNTSENDRPKKCTSDKRREKAKCNYAQTRAKAHILQHAHAGTCIATRTRTRNTQEEINIFTHVRS